MPNRPVPVSGEDQPDLRVSAAVQALQECFGNKWSGVARRILEAIDSADRAAGIRRVTEEQARTAFHVPQIAQRSDDRWGVFCAACSAEISDYVYPCRLPDSTGWWAQLPPILSGGGS